MSSVENNKFIDSARQFATEQQEIATPYSATEYFSMLLERGADTREQGNYGIAAALVLRQQGTEVIIFGANTLKTESNPTGHAETNAIMLGHKIVQGDQEAFNQLIEEGRVAVRQAPHQEKETFLYTSLEPCPMCATAAINTGSIDKVVIATADRIAGGMLPARLSPTAPLWGGTAKAQEMDVVLCQNVDPEKTDTYLPPKLQENLNELFFGTREGLDEDLAKNGFAGKFTDSVAALAANYLHSIANK